MSPEQATVSQGNPAPAGNAGAAANEPPKNPANRKSVIEIIKDAYDKGLIGKEEYEKAIYRLLKKEVTGEEDAQMTELKIFRQNDKFRIVLEKGELDIPTDEKTEVTKDGNVLVIRSGSGHENSLDAKDPKFAIPFSDTPAQHIQEIKDVFDPEELANIEQAFKSMNTSNQEVVFKNETSTLRDDLELIDLRKEFAGKEEEEPEVAPEEKKEAEEPGVLDGLIDKLSRVTGRLKQEDRSEKLRRLSLENLAKIKELKDERRAIIGVAYVLKQFLQVRFGIPREVTYHELAEEIKGKNIDKGMKEQLMDFFKKMPIMMYAKIQLNESLPKAYNLAEKTINELAEGLE